MLNPVSSQSSPEALLGPAYAGKSFYRGKITSPTPPPPRAYWPDKRDRYYFYKSCEGDTWTTILDKLKLTVLERKRFMKLNALATYGLTQHTILPPGTTLFIDLDFSELPEWPAEFLMNILLPKQADQQLWWEVYRICTKQSKSFEESMNNLGAPLGETSQLLRAVWDLYDYLCLQHEKTPQGFSMSRKRPREIPQGGMLPIQPPKLPKLPTKYIYPAGMSSNGEEPLAPIVKSERRTGRKPPSFDTERKSRKRKQTLQTVQLSSGRCVIVDAQRISPFRTLYCHHCNTKFSARPSQRRPQSAFVLNHACSGQKRTQFVIGKRHRRCDFGCSLKVGCIKFVDE